MIQLVGEIGERVWWRRTCGVDAVYELVADYPVNSLGSVFCRVDDGLVEGGIGDECSGSLDGDDTGGKGQSSDEVSSDGGHGCGCNVSII